MTFKVKQRDIAKIVKKSREPLQPVFEAIQNAIESVFMAKKKGICVNPYVKITFFYRANSDLFSNTITKLDKIEIEDNGEGFDDVNLDRFQSLFDTTKNFRNKGTGKLQIFHRFGDISVKSRYKDGDNILGLEFRALEIMENGSCSDYDSQLFHTTVSLIEPNNTTIEEYGVYSEIDKLYSEITEHFFLSLSLSDVIPDITISVDINGKVESRELKKEDFQQPEKKDDFLVHKTEPSLDISIDEWKKSEEAVKFEWRRFKFSPQYVKKNEVYLCSKNLPVEKRQIPSINKTTALKDEAGNEYFYILAITSDFLDDASLVNDSRTGFNIINKRQWVDNDEFQSNSAPQIFMDDVEDEVQIVVADVFDDLAEMKSKLRELVSEISEKYHISPDVRREAERGIRINDKGEIILAKLYSAEAKILKNNDVLIHQQFEKLKSIDPTSDDYQQNLDTIARNIMLTIPKANCIQLGSYVARREMLVGLLDLTLNNQLEIQKKWQKDAESGKKVKKDNEGLIHDIIFKRRTDSVNNEDHNLWMFGEEFMHFSYVSSDIPLKDVKLLNKKIFKDEIESDAALDSLKITKGRKRPDILIFKETGKVIIFEFKAPDVELSHHINQIERYARLLANFTIEDLKIKEFYGFLIGEKIDPMEVVGGFKPKIDEEGWFNPYTPILSTKDHRTEIASLYQEILKLSEISKLASIRNSSFANRLGIKPKKEESSSGN